MNVVPAVRVTNLRRQYGSRVALDGVSFSVGRGEIFALLGPNGGGKTTLFKILSTLLPATSGEVEILGQSLTQNPHAVRSCLGVVFQHPSLDLKLTVMENLPTSRAFVRITRANATGAIHGHAKTLWSGGSG